MADAGPVAPMLGVDAKVYYLTGARSSWGTLDEATGFTAGADPGVTELQNVHGDVKLPMTKGDADVTIRPSLFKLHKATRRENVIDIPMIWDPAGTIDGGFLAFDVAKRTRAKIALAFLDGDIETVGAKGIWADFKVVKIKKTEVQDGVQMCVVTVAPALTAVPLEFIIISA